MKIVFDKYTHIYANNKEEFKKIYDLVFLHLRFVNPSFEQGNKNETQFFELFEINYQEMSFKLPKNINALIKNLIMFGTMIETFENKRVNKNEHIGFKANFEPRDEQQKQSIDEFFNVLDTHATLGALCGFGKSFSSLKILEKINKKTLIIVDQVLILEQWVDYITEWSNYTEEQIGIIQGSDNIDISKNIIIATIQTLDNIPEISNILAEEISFIIVDECHCAAASTFQKTLYNFKPKYLLGLSATLERDDNMTFLITHAIGENYFVADRQKMVDQGLLIKPDLRPIFMKRKNFYNENGNKNNINKYYRETLNDFKNDKMVIKFIAELAAHHKKQGDQILMIIKEEEYSEKFYEMLLKRLIFTQEQINDFKKQADKINEEKLQKAIYRKTNQIKNQIVPKVNEIKEKIQNSKQTKFACVTSHEHNQMKKNIEAETKKIEIVKVEWYELPEVEESSRIAWILGKTKKIRRKQIIEKAKNKEIDIIITTKLFDKALSINSLNILFNVFPNKELANTYQRVGRVSRTHKNKTYAIVYDFIYMHGIFFNQFFNKNKKCRMMAYQETCILPEYMEEFIKYLQKLFFWKEDDLKSFTILQKNKHFCIVDLDELEGGIKNEYNNS